MIPTDTGSKRKSLGQGYRTSVKIFNIVVTLVAYLTSRGPVGYPTDQT